MCDFCSSNCHRTYYAKVSLESSVLTLKTWQFFFPFIFMHKTNTFRYHSSHKITTLNVFFTWKFSMLRAYKRRCRLRWWQHNSFVIEMASFMALFSAILSMADSVSVRWVEKDGSQQLFFHTTHSSIQNGVQMNLHNTLHYLFRNGTYRRSRKSHRQLHSYYNLCKFYALNMIYGKNGISWPKLAWGGQSETTIHSTGF